MKTLFVGNLPIAIRESQLKEIFEPIGPVHRLSIPLDRATGEQRGIAFVDMDDAPAELAMTALNGCRVQDRRIRIAEANPR